MKELTYDLVERLSSLRTAFSPAAELAKSRILARAAKRTPHDARTIREYHETLLFLRAYPDDKRIFQLADSELRRIGRIIIESTGSRGLAKRLKNTGIHGTEVRYGYSLDMLAWLAERFPGDVELLWHDESLGEQFDEFLPNLVARPEADGLLTDRLSTLQWLHLSKGARRSSDLNWLVRRFQRLHVAGPLRDQVFDPLAISVKWRLRKIGAARTFCRLPNSRTFLHRDGIRRLHSLREALDSPIPPARPLAHVEAERCLDVCRASLAVRQRETDAVTYPNPREVFRWSLDRGFDVVLYGMQPSRRLPIESFFGFHLFKNGLPLGYGGGWVFLDRCEIGVNIFDTFRGGESAFGFAQVMRVFRWFFRVHRFTVDPYQFGEGNAEAIKSGAFWFYYRLGFRPTQEKLRILADEEFAKLQKDRTQRTPAAILRRLARAHLALDVGKTAVAPPELCDIGLALTQWIGRRFGGDLYGAIRWSEQRLVSAGGPISRAGWSTEERIAFDGMLVLTGLIPDLSEWSRAETRDLVDVLRSKGGLRESTYVRRLRNHARFRCTLCDAARIGAKIVTVRPTPSSIR